MLRRFFIANNKGNDNRACKRPGSWLENWLDNRRDKLLASLHHRTTLAIRMPILEGLASPVKPAASTRLAC
jgi:hypothetical protein